MIMIDHKMIPPLSQKHSPMKLIRSITNVNNKNARYAILHPAINHNANEIIL
jgi:hypothetical protein